jgi:hypothetical protein
MEQRIEMREVDVHLPVGGIGLAAETETAQERLLQVHVAIVCAGDCDGMGNADQVVKSICPDLPVDKQAGI